MAQGAEAWPPRPLARCARVNRSPCNGMDFQYFIELFFGGLTRGSIYALIALGYTLV